MKNKLREYAETTVGLAHISMTKVKNTFVHILKPAIIQKYGLNDDFEFMDKLKNDISNTLKHQEEITKQMMKLILDNTIDDPSNISETDDGSKDGSKDEVYVPLKRTTKIKKIKYTTDEVSKDDVSKDDKSKDDVSKDEKLKNDKSKDGSKDKSKDKSKDGSKDKSKDKSKDGKLKRTTRIKKTEDNKECIDV
jgi:hypothetical protein